MRYICTLALLLAFPVFASEAGSAMPRLALPDATNTFVDKTYGFTIDVPRHFELTGDESGLLYFQSSRKPGLIVIRPTPGMGLKNVQQLMREGFESPVTSLRTDGAPLTLGVRNGQGMTMPVKGKMQGQPVEGYLAGIFGPQGQGYMVLIGAITNKWPILEPDALRIMESFGLIRIEPGHEHERWYYRLAGRRLVFVEGYGRPFEGSLFSSDITLCANGEFHSRQSSGSYYDDAYWGSSEYHSTSKKSGTWRIGYEGLPYLRTNAKRGNVVTAVIEYRDGYYFLEGVPFGFAQNTICP